MMGTLATALAGRKIPTHTERYVAEVEGDIEDVDGVLRITVIRVVYRLKVPAGRIEDAYEAFAGYIEKCPAAVSVRGCIDVRHEFDVSELDPR